MELCNIWMLDRSRFFVLLVVGEPTTPLEPFPVDPLPLVFAFCTVDSTMRKITVLRIELTFLFVPNSPVFMRFVAIFNETMRKNPLCILTENARNLPMVALFCPRLCTL